MCRMVILLVACTATFVTQIQAQDFILRVPGRSTASVATLSAVDGDLVIRDAVGREWVYLRAPEYDTSDGTYRGFYCAAADRWLLWPRDGAGKMHVGYAGADGKVVFRPSAMTVTRSAKRVIVENRVVLPPPPEADPIVVPADKYPLNLPGAYYVEGTEGGVAYIRRNQKTKVLEYVDPEGTTGLVDWEPKAGAVVIERGGKKVQGSATQEILSFDKSKWVRIAILGCYVDSEDNLHEVVLHDGRITVRGVNEAGEMVHEPLAVISPVEVTCPGRGKARLRNNRIVWSDTKEEWIGPIWLEGFWDFGGKHCEIEQDGASLTLANENKELSKGKIMNARTLVATDWNLRATFNTRQNSLKFTNGDSWIRLTVDEFPTEDLAEPAVRKERSGSKP